jgi:hypothetical protein
MNRFGWMALAGLAASLTLGIVSSQASEVMFSFTETGDQLAETFLIDQSPAMDPYSTASTANSPQVNVTVYAPVGGGKYQTQMTSESFAMFANGVFADGYFDDLQFRQWFTGAVDAPTFIPGTYKSNVNFGGNPSQGIVTMTITAVPEPATWLMMMVGLGGLGATLRQRRRTAASAWA